MSPKRVVKILILLSFQCNILSLSYLQPRPYRVCEPDDVIVFNRQHSLDFPEKLHGIFKRLRIWFLQCYTVGEVIVIDYLALIFLDGFQQRLPACFLVIHYQKHVRRMFLFYMLRQYGDRWLHRMPGSA